MIVSLEAIFPSAFVLISQNKQAVQADKRAKIDLQVNIIAERETTKILKMVTEIQQHLGIAVAGDAELATFGKPTDVNQLADALDQAEERLLGKEAESPKSAADTSR